MAIGAAAVWDMETMLDLAQASIEVLIGEQEVLETREDLEVAGLPKATSEDISIPAATLDVRLRRLMAGCLGRSDSRNRMAEGGRSLSLEAARSPMEAAQGSTDGKAMVTSGSARVSGRSKGLRARTQSIARRNRDLGGTQAIRIARMAGISVAAERQRVRVEAPIGLGAVKTPRASVAVTAGLAARPVLAGDIPPRALEGSAAAVATRLRRLLVVAARTSAAAAVISVAGAIPGAVTQVVAATPADITVRS
jgi:hypothetical protein